MMYPTKAAAEQAAINGKGDDYDTQLCIGLQAEILSSSPLRNTMIASGTASQGIDAAIDRVYVDMDYATPPEHDRASQATLPLGQNLQPFNDTAARSRRDTSLPDLEDTASKPTRIMDDLTQKSYLSSTQENSESAYVRFHTSYLDAAQPVENRAAVLGAQETKTDSTAQTYLEDHPGHINFDDLVPSQRSDTRVDVPATHLASATKAIPMPPYSEPKTPAQLVNPFFKKGTVMKAVDMFEQTQPLSAGPKLSPTSSRPSPDFCSKRLINTAEDNCTPPRRTPSSSPLRLSMQRLLCPSSRESPVGTNSFDLNLVLHRTNVLPEPRKYVSVKESQERWIEDSSSMSPNSDLDTQESQRKRQRRLLREKTISKELATIEIQKSQTPTRVGNSGRRHSWSEDYIAPCNGFDTRDTQQELVVVDSQNVEGSEVFVLPEDSRGKCGPLQELSSNCKKLRTPSKVRIRSNETTIPETSPAITELRPMTEIASLSFSADPEICDLPGFTQDTEFETAMHIPQLPYSPKPSMPRKLSGSVEQQSLHCGRVTPTTTESFNKEQAPNVGDVTPSSELSSVCSSLFNSPSYLDITSSIVSPQRPRVPTPTTSRTLDGRQTTHKTSPTAKRNQHLTSRRASRHLGRDLSEDPISLINLAPTISANPKKTDTTLFKDMAFAISYVKHKSKDQVRDLIINHGGQILEDGFTTLFETDASSSKLILTSAAKLVGFVALIADEHSRKAKYMEALALGLPCISGLWITACVMKKHALDWSPYLLAAGHSSFLGNATKSRFLRPYATTAAKFAETFAARDRLLDGKSILVVTGKSRADKEKRKAYIFLARAMEPSRLAQVYDNSEARNKLLESQNNGQTWDLVYVDKNEEVANYALFGSNLTTSTKAPSKRKRGPALLATDLKPAPMVVRIVTDEIVIQSLIFGQLLE